MWNRNVIILLLRTTVPPSLTIVFTRCLVSYRGWNILIINFIFLILSNRLLSFAIQKWQSHKRGHSIRIYPLYLNTVAVVTDPIIRHRYLEIWRCHNHNVLKIGVKNLTATALTTSHTALCNYWTGRRWYNTLNINGHGLSAFYYIVSTLYDIARLVCWTRYCRSITNVN